MMKLRFHVTQSEPEYAKLFLATGGSINAAAGPGKTDFAVTGSTESVAHQLNNIEATEVTIQLPEGYTIKDTNTIHLDSRTKLNVLANRTGAAINGTIVDTHAGAGSMYLSTILNAKSHVQLPLVYSAFAAHSATLGISGAKIVDEANCEMNVHFEKDDTKDKLFESAEQIIDSYAQCGWDLRQKGLVYTPSPTLTKTVAKTPVGIAEKGYNLVHNVLKREIPFGIETLNSLFESCIGHELEFDAEEVENFLKTTQTPGIEAAIWAKTVAGACSTAANFLISYRADGNTTLAPTGSTFTAAESWLHSTMRSPVDANDCDGSALLITSMIQRCIDATDEELAENEYVRAVRNSVTPYYTPVVSVVGASAAEASGGGGTHIAGHAVALLLDTIGLLHAIDKGMGKKIQNFEKSASDPSVLRNARFSAIFNDSVLETLPADERAILAQGPEVVGAVMEASDDSSIGFHSLESFAIEGTTPASATLYAKSSEKAKRAALDSKRDVAAFAKLAPNVGRSFKTLYSGNGADHKFYKDFVEVSLHPDHPLFSDTTVRKLGAAATQFVLSEEIRSEVVETCGATPRQLVDRQYMAFPMITIDEKSAKILDEASAIAAKDVVPRRGGSMTLSAAQTRDLILSKTALKTLDESLSKDGAVGHPVAYLLAFSTLINNPQSIEHLCAVVQSHALAGEIDFKLVNGLAQTEDGEEAGLFVVINAIVG